MRVIIVLALVGAALAAPQHEFWKSEESAQRIVGGVGVIINEYPFMSQMVVRSWSQYETLCGSTLISTRAALTAARCFMHSDISAWRIRVGSSFVNGGGVHYSIDAFIIHPEHIAPAIHNDIAVVKIASPLVLSNTVGIATLAVPGSVVADNDVVTAVGFGTLRFDAVRPTTLQRVHINVINHNICASRYAYLRTIPEFEDIPPVTADIICAGILDIGGRGTCGGDPGGPLIHNSKVVSIITRGHSCAQPYFPGVSVSVAYHYEWIAETANLNEEQ